MRLFAAVEIPQKHLDSVDAAAEPLRKELPGARWTVRWNWHVTVKFFGEVPDEEVDDLVEAVAGVARAAVPLESQLLDVGAFPSLRRARVLWVGIEDPQSRLGALSQELSRVSAKPAEKRPLHPHLTLARFKVPARVEKLVEEYRPFDLDRSPFTIDRLTLFRSHLSSRGARYEVLDRVVLSTGFTL